MMTRALRIKALVLAATACLLAACSGPNPAKITIAQAPPTAAQLTEAARKQFAEFEAGGSPQGEVLAAIHSDEAALYDKMIDIAAKPTAGAAAAQETLAIARPLYLEAYARKAPYASDTDINELVNILIATHKALLAKDALLCAQGEKADLAKVTELTPPGLVDREYRLEARVLKVPDRSAPRAAQGEIEAWKAKTFKGDEPRLQGNKYFEITDPTPDQAAKICDAELFILEAIAREKPERRAYLYRGLMAPR